MRILGIETSCDETAAAVIEVHRQQFTVHSNIVASQIKIHAKTGGVVPEVAARAHVEAILPTVKLAMQNAECRMQNPGSDIDAIAVTAGPGLMTSLLVGVEVARTLSVLWKKPLIAVNHLAGHVYANWLNANGRESQGEWSRILFPALALIVSGGHTELVLMKKHLDFKIIGSTRDDAAGEAFDKVAKMLGLPYPGGPAVSALAEKFCKVSSPSPESSPIKGEEQKGNSPPLVGGVRGGGIQFPRPMMNSNDFDFSFSGLKTSVLYYLRSAGFYAPSAAHKMPRYKLEEVCYEFQEAVVDVLVTKTIRAAKQYNVKTILLGGGVAANKRLREQLGHAVKKELPATSYSLPTLSYTGDNAAMIAAAGYFMARSKQFTPWEKIDVDPNWELGKKMQSMVR